MITTVFKNGAGKWLTQALFYETSNGEREYCVFTLKNEDMEVDGITYWSLRKKFVESNDPTEYEFANLWLGGWAHWQDLCKSEALKPHIEEWREERDVRFRSMGVKKLVDLASGEDASFQAAKWLADGGWERPKHSRGRPSKAEVARETKKHVAVSKRVASDMERLKAIG